MRRIKLLLDNGNDYEFYDSQRVRLVLERAGVYATDMEARWLWRAYSDSMCAGWMTLPDSDADVLAAIEPYFEQGETF